MKTIATVGGIGYFPIGPGTVASAVGLGAAWLLRSNPAYQVIGAAVVLILALWSAGPAARALGNADPTAVVIDEVMGMMVAVATLPATWPVYLAAFILFRLLDILKPIPIRQVEKLPGSWGIVLDDLLAGILANLLVRAGLLLIS